MEWITCLRKVLAYIEDNLESDIDISDAADAVFVSPFYLQKGFQIMTGYTLGEYIRSRRLYEAAKAILNTDEKVIDIALRYGYDTPESFTKAFSRFHGCTPSAMRRGKNAPRIFLPLSIHVTIQGGNKMNYTVSPMFAFKLIGFPRVFDYETSYKEIPKFWDEICEKYCRNIYNGKPAATPQEKAIQDNCIGEYGVCIDDIGGGKFRYLIAGRYCGGEVPDGMELVEFPGGEWAKFKCVGPIPEAFQTLNTRIFKEWLPGNPEYEMAGNYNIEWYSCEREKTDADYESGIWLPVKRYADEVKETYGATEAYKESVRKSANRTAEGMRALGDGMMEIFSRFGKIKNGAPDSAEAKALAKELQQYITDNFYNCTNEIFLTLSDVYTGDERFKNNIDRSGGEGCAEFASRAIKEYLA